MAPATFETLLKKHPVSFRTVRKGDLIEGKVVAILDKEALIDVGSKAEGILPAAEFKDQKLKVDQPIWVFVSAPENRQGQTLLSLKKARGLRSWILLTQAMEKGGVVQATVNGHNKGGLVATVLGLTGFVPFSHLSDPPDTSMEKAVLQSFLDRRRGEVLKTKVLEVDERQNRIILSEREAVEEENLALRAKKIATISLGDTYEVEISAILPYGLRVNIDGLEGLIEPGEIDWEKRAVNLSDFKPGQKVAAKVIEVNPDLGRVKFSAKQTRKDPWEKIETKLPIGEKVKATVIKITSFGVFLKTDTGYEVVLPLLEVEGRDIQLDQELEVAIDEIDAANRMIRVKWPRP